MKKGQSGVSLIALVITIIVVIILAAIAFGTSTRTITNANWSTFQNAVGEVRTALQTRVTTVKGEEAAKGRNRTDAQVYNYVAKGADEKTDPTADAWLSRGYADGLSATRIEPTVIDSTLGLKGRNIIKVNTPLASGREISFFVTREGSVFVWPPYEYENNWYVNETSKLDAYDSTGAAVAYDGKTANFEKIVRIKVGGVYVDIANGTSSKVVAGQTINDLIANKTAEEIINAKVPTVYYDDISNAPLPVGIETKDGNGGAGEWYSEATNGRT